MHLLLGLAYNMLHVYNIIIHCASAYLEGRQSEFYLYFQANFAVFFILRDSISTLQM